MSASSLLDRRPECAVCVRPARACICHWIRPANNRAAVLILQHPDEAREAKGTGRLLHLSLRHSTLKIGEQWTQADLFGSLKMPFAERVPLLLYPPDPNSTPNITSSSVPPDLAPERLCVVVLDATWRKSRTLLRNSPALQTLPRLALSDPPPSSYRIRKAHRPEQLSTLEASCHALAQLEGDLGPYRPLLDAFEGFVAERLAFADTDKVADKSHDGRH